MNTWTEIYYISERIIQIVMLFVILKRRRRGTAMAWLLVVFSLPWLGLILYWMVGENKLPRQRIHKHAHLMRRLKQSLRHFVGQHETSDMPTAIDQTSQIAQRLAEMPIVGGNKVKLLAGAEAVVGSMLADIEIAAQHIHMIYYIYADDDNGQAVAEALMRAAARGVECRLMVDSVGSRPMLKHLAPRLRAAGVEVVEALPVGFFRRRAERLDLRNHRKLMVIDGQVGYVGSQNISNPGYGKRRLYLYDLTMRLEGPILLELQAVFSSDWQFETDELLEGPRFFQPPNNVGKVEVQALPSGPNYPTQNYQRMVISAIYMAKESLTLTTPYFIPDDSLVHALEIARLRGVRVDIIIPQRSDHFLVDAAARAYFEELLEAGVHIYLFRHGLLHAKTLTVDATFCLFGSGNFDIRSFTINFELSLCFYGADATRLIREQQMQYLAESDEIFLAHWQQRPLRQMLSQNMACLLSPLL